MQNSSQALFSSITLLLALCCGLVLVSCSSSDADVRLPSEVAPAEDVLYGEMKFPEIIGTDISGAPKLQPPMLVMGGSEPVLTEKHGLAAPALWDWDGDGKRDLLVGEFETNSGDNFPMGELGSTIRVYLNIGTNDDPKFSSEFEWARDTEGTIMEVPQWCCIGFTPYFYDLNHDGYEDMITGQYHPGEVTWFRGSEHGFLPGVKLEQAGDPASSWSTIAAPAAEEPPSDPKETFDYWVYSSAAMGDLDDDGDYDLVFGGSALKFSENVGTKEEPKFGPRTLLVDVTGKPLSVGASASDEAIATWPFTDEQLAGDSKISPYVVDWDRDGVLDLLVTNSYIREDSFAVAFFRGVKVYSQHRFHPPVDLLATADGSKALPGSGPRIYVDDWNLDGTPDLIIGASVATVNGGEFSDELSWEWESVNNVESAGKDPGLYPPREKPTREQFLAQAEELGSQWWESEEEFDEFLEMNVKYWQQTVGVLYDTGREHWLTMRHQGRVYVMLGADEKTPDTPVKQVINPKPQVDETSQVPTESTVPVNVELFVPEEVQQGGQAEVSLSIAISEGWYIYAPTGRNAEQGMKETQVSFEFAENLSAIGSVKMPIHQFKGSYEVFRGPHLTITQRVGTEDCDPGQYEITSEVTYQTCNDDRCLPPKTVKLVGVLTVAAN